MQSRKPRLFFRQTSNAKQEARPIFLRNDDLNRAVSEREGGAGVDIAEFLIGITSPVPSVRDENFSLDQFGSAIAACTASAAGLIGNTGTFQRYSQRLC